MGRPQSPLKPPPPQTTQVAVSPSPYLVATQTSNLVLLSLALLVSSGVLIRTLNPNFRYRRAPAGGGGGGGSVGASGTAAGKGSKRRESMLKSIRRDQEAADIVVPGAAGAVGASTTGSNSAGTRSRADSAANGGGGARSRSSSSVASTSAAIVQGLTVLANVATSSPSGSGSRSPSTAPKDRAPSPSPFLLDQSMRKVSSSSKGKKGKGVALPALVLSSSTLAPPSPGAAPSPSLSPRRRPMKHVGVSVAGPSTTEASVQTSPPPAPTLDDPSFVIPPLPDSPNYPPLEYPLPPFEWSPAELSFQDAIVQTSPRLFPTRPPPIPYNLHASFQSTPPSSRQPSSPPLSPSPRHPERPALQSRTSTSTSSTSLHPTPPASTPSTSRSRKQRNKAAALSGLAANAPYVVGLPRPPRSREPTDESEEANVLLLSPSVGRGGPWSFGGRGIVDSPESTSSSLPPTSATGRDSGKGRERDSGLGPAPPPNGVGGGRGVAVLNGATLMPGMMGQGRSSIPSPIPIPPSHASQPYPPPRRRSTQSTASSAYGTLASSVTSSSNSSPYLNHLGALTMSPASETSTRRTSVTARSESGRKEDGEGYWPLDLGHEAWGLESHVVGLGVDVDSHERGREGEGGRRPSEGPHMRDGRTWSEAAAGPRGSMSSRASSPSGTNISGGADGYFPTPPSVQSPPTSPENVPAAYPAILPFQSMTSVPGRPWSPHLMASQYTMIPHPGQPGAVVPSSLAHASPSIVSSQSRPSSRQSSLSVPVASSRDQQQQQLQQQQAHLHQQQQAYAFAHAQAQAQYHHAVAMQLHAQQLHAQQSAQRAHRIQQEQHLQHHSISPANGQTPSRHNSLQSPTSVYQTPTSAANEWTSVPSSPAYGMHTASPTSANFPPAGYPYYTSPTTPYYNAPNGHFLHSTSQPRSQPDQQSNGGPRLSKGGGSRESRKGGNSPRIGGSEKSAANGGKTVTKGGVVVESAGWQIKLRTAEMEADRNGKELEIARWRLAVLEEDRLAAERDNQEALSALANRARRAEARLKLLEEAQRQDSSSASASGSGSPITGPSSVTESAELPLPELPATTAVEDDLACFASPPGVTVHPLAWVDLDSVNFNTQPSHSQSRSRFLASPNLNGGNGNRRSSARFNGADSGGGSFTRRRSGNQNRRRSTNSHTPDHAPVEDGTSDDDVVIVLDSPARRKPRQAPSRRSSFRHDGQESDGFDDDDISNVDLDEDDGEERVNLDYYGFLPTFITTQVPSTSSSVEQASASSATATATTTPDSLPATNEGTVPIPCFVLGCATPSPSPHEETTPDAEKTPQIPHIASPATEEPPPILTDNS